jgi:hypothetical protein
MLKLDHNQQFELEPDEFYGQEAIDLALLPIFPASRPLILEDKPMFDRMLRSFRPETSELTFTNLFAWRNVYQFSVSSLFGYLIVLRERDGALELLDPIGPIWTKRAVIEACFQRIPPQTSVSFVKLPQITTSMFADASQYSLSQDRDNSDYVYSNADLTFLRGNGYDGKRNQIKRFNKSTTFEYLPLTDSDISDALAFERQWYQSRDCAGDDSLLHERQALEEMLLNFTALGIVGGIIKVGGKIVALSLGECLNSDTMVVHIEKADAALPGVYQTINMLFAQSEGEGFAFINREQDLGIPGLRQAKESYHPHHMAAKYTLERL